MDERLPCPQPWSGCILLNLLADAFSGGASSQAAKKESDAAQAGLLSAAKRRNLHRNELAKP